MIDWLVILQAGVASGTVLLFATLTLLVGGSLHFIHGSAPAAETRLRAEVRAARQD